MHGPGRGFFYRRSGRCADTPISRTCIRCALYYIYYQLLLFPADRSLLRAPAGNEKILLRANSIELEMCIDLNKASKTTRDGPSI